MTDTNTETKSRRPADSIARDARTVELLGERDYNRHELDDVLGTTWRVTYGALTRLRTQGLVELKRTGTRTPVWGLTKAGVKHFKSLASEEAKPEDAPVMDSGLVEVTEAPVADEGFQTIPA